jgi:NAD-dependent SIR2 family protein deacetylase
MTKLRQSIKRARPTDTHLFVLALYDAGKLVREYTQNIDGMSERAGLWTGVRAMNAALERTKRDREECDL